MNLNKSPTILNPAQSSSDFDELWQSQKKANQYMGWIVAFMLFLLMVGGIVAWMFKGPDLIQEVVPFAYDQQTGAYQQMMRIDKGESVTPSEGMTRADLERFVTARESYQYYNMKGGNGLHTLVQSMAVGDVAVTYGNVISAYLKLPDPTSISVYADVHYVSPTGGETRTVRFAKRLIGANGKETITNHIATVTFEYDYDLELPPDQAVKNPLRMQIYYYNVEADVGGDL